MEFDSFFDFDYLLQEGYRFSKNYFVLVHL